MDMDTSEKIYGITNDFKTADFYATLVIGVVVAGLMNVLYLLQEELFSPILWVILEVLIIGCFFYLGLSSARYIIVDCSGVSITFRNFRTWTVHYAWEDYCHIRLDYFAEGRPKCRILCKKIKRHPREWLFSGTVVIKYTTTNYELIKSWIKPETKLDIPTKRFLRDYKRLNRYK